MIASHKYFMVVKTICYKQLTCTPVRHDRGRSTHNGIKFDHVFRNGMLVLHGKANALIVMDTNRKGEW